MSLPEYPVALGVIRAINAQTHDAVMIEQHERVQAKSRIRTVDELKERINLGGEVGTLG